MASYNSQTANGTDWYARNRFCMVRWWHPTTALKANMPSIVRFGGGAWNHNPWVFNDLHDPTANEVGGAGPLFDALRAAGFVCFNIERPQGSNSGPTHGGADHYQIGEAQAYPFLHMLQGRIVQFIRRHAADGTFFGGDATKTISTSVPRMGLHCNSSGALMGMALAFEQDGFLDFDPINAFSADRFAAAHSHKVGFIFNDESLLDWARFDSASADWDARSRQGTGYFGRSSQYADIDAVPLGTLKAAGCWDLLRANAEHNRDVAVFSHHWGENSDLLAASGAVVGNGITKAQVLTAWDLDAPITASNAPAPLWDPHDPIHGAVLERELQAQDALNGVGVSRHRFWWGNATNNPTGTPATTNQTTIGNAVRDWIVNDLGVTP